MGVVFKAEDTRLHRFVLRKFQPENVAKDPQMLKRFHREAQAESALNHPNISTIYDTGEADSKAFMAMECLEGQTLKHRISERAMELDTLLACIPLRRSPRYYQRLPQVCRPQSASRSRKACATSLAQGLDYLLSRRGRPMFGNNPLQRASAPDYKFTSGRIFGFS